MTLALSSSRTLASSEVAVLNTLETAAVETADSVVSVHFEVSVFRVLRDAINVSSDLSTSHKTVLLNSISSNMVIRGPAGILGNITLSARTMQVSANLISREPKFVPYGKPTVLLLVSSHFIVIGVPEFRTMGIMNLLGGAVHAHESDNSVSVVKCDLCSSLCRKFKPPVFLTSTDQEILNRIGVLKCEAPTSKKTITLYQDWPELVELFPSGFVKMKGHTVARVLKCEAVILKREIPLVYRSIKAGRFESSLSREELEKIIEEYEFQVIENSPLMKAQKLLECTIRETVSSYSPLKRTREVFVSCAKCSVHLELGKLLDYTSEAQSTHGFMLTAWSQLLALSASCGGFLRIKGLLVSVLRRNSAQGRLSTHDLIPYSLEFERLLRSGKRQLLASSLAQIFEISCPFFALIPYFLALMTSPPEGIMSYVYRHGYDTDGIVSRITGSVAWSLYELRSEMLYGVQRLEKLAQNSKSYGKLVSLIGERSILCTEGASGSHTLSILQILGRELSRIPVVVFDVALCAGFHESSELSILNICAAMIVGFGRRDVSDKVYRRDYAIIAFGKRLRDEIEDLDEAYFAAQRPLEAVVPLPEFSRESQTSGAAFLEVVKSAVSLPGSFANLTSIPFTGQGSTSLPPRSIDDAQVANLARSIIQSSNAPSGTDPILKVDSDDDDLLL